MQNIDPIFILQPVIVIILCAALLLYWRHKRHFHAVVLLYSFAAYFGAIAIKSVVQTIGFASGITLRNVGLGIYYGLQTVILEIGLAYLVARYAISHHALGKKDAEAYGAGLAFWENGILLGLFALINLVAYYFILSMNTPLAQTVYRQLSENAPGYFLPAQQAVGIVAFGTLERISSILAHSAWGYLCFASALSHDKRLFLIALPMGFIDFIVPFAPSLALPLFETIVFLISAVFVLVAWFATERFRRGDSYQESF